MIDPVILTLPSNGIRLRFDGPEQRLRLIEIIDFRKNYITFNEKDLMRYTISSSSPGESTTGPTFRHIYNRLLGPTYDGEYIATQSDDCVGKYVLSYPGVAFTFPLPESFYSPSKDVVSLLSSPGAQVAHSMAVFTGDSWAQSREQLWTKVLPSIKTFAPLVKGKDTYADEISLIKVHGGGRLQLFKNWSSSASVWIKLGETSPQDLVAELGPPNAIYRKNDQRMHIHKMKSASHSRVRPTRSEFPDEVFTDMDQSSAQTTDDSENDDSTDDDAPKNPSGECFFNYFYLGFDVLLSRPVQPSPLPPTLGNANPGVNDAAMPQIRSSDVLVATKLIIHGNVPGSYPFNRHRRCRWEISYLAPNQTEIDSIHSESFFPEVQSRLQKEWAPAYASEEEAAKQQRGMVLNRGWGDSPGSSIELLGGWEGDPTGQTSPRQVNGSEDSTSTLYGFPGLVFEVLRNGTVSALTVF